MTTESITKDSNPIWRNAAFCMAAAGLLSLLIPMGFGLFGHDAGIQISWITQFTQAVAEGNPYPRWMSDGFYGFGSPAFYFYPPLIFYIASIFRVLGISSSLGLFHVTTIFFTVLSFFSSFLVLKQIVGNKTAAFWGAAIYCLIPYRFADMYLRNAFSEHAAFAFFPIVLLPIYLIASKQQLHWKRILFPAAIGWGFLLITNIPSAIVAAYSVVIFALACRLYRKEYRMMILFYIAGSLVGLALSSFFLLPIGQLQTAISSANYLNMNYYSYQLTGYALIDAFHVLQSNTFYISLLIVFILTLIALWQIREKIKYIRQCEMIEQAEIFILCFAVLIQIPYISKPLWLFLPMMRMLQFTWRWDIWITFFLSVFVARGITRSKHLQKSYGFIMLVAASTLALVSVYTFNIRKLPELDYPKIANMMATEYLPHNITLPGDSVIGLLSEHRKDPLIQRKNGSVAFRLIDDKALLTSFNASVSSEKGEITFRRTYFPTWRLADDRGIDYPIRPDSLGRIVATLPNGNRNYVLKIIKINEEKIGSWISCFAAFGLLGLFMFTTFWRNSKDS